MKHLEMRFHQTTLASMVLLLCVVSASGSAFPLFDGNGHWLDKLPSFEVKVKTDGISVSTGPSREEMYAMVGYFVLGGIFVIVLAIIITLCVYKFCCLRSVAQHVSFQRVTDANPQISLHSSAICGNPVVGTHLWSSMNKPNESSRIESLKTSRCLNIQPVVPRPYRSAH